MLSLGVEIEPASSGWGLKLSIGDYTDSGGSKGKIIKIKGRFPHKARGKVRFLVSLFDEDSGGTLQPIVSTRYSLQEEATNTFLLESEKISARPKQGRIPNWHLINVPIMLNTLVGPYSGHRRLKAVVRLVKASDEADPHFGRMNDCLGKVIWTCIEPFMCDLDRRGYFEPGPKFRIAYQHLYRLGIYLAKYPHGTDPASIGQTTWDILSELPLGWARIERFFLTGMTFTERYLWFKDAVLNSIQEVVFPDYDFEDSALQLMRHGDQSVYHDAVEVFYELISVEEKINPDQLKLVDRIIDVLDFHPDTVRLIRDTKLAGLDYPDDPPASIEDLLGIKPSWDSDKKLEFLNDEYSKWNRRITVLPEGKEKKFVQRKLDRIGKLLDS